MRLAVGYAVRHNGLRMTVIALLPPKPKNGKQKPVREGTG